MNAKRRWCELLLIGMVVLLILAAGNIQTAKAQYQYVEGEDNDDDTNESEEGPGEDVGASSSSNESGELSCSVWVNCDANGVSGPSSASGYASGWGYYSIDWTWSGPPGYAPGGTLTWYTSGIGNAYAWGNNTIDGGSAVAASDADSDIGSSGTIGTSSAGGGAWGFVEDDDLGVGTFTWIYDPWEDFDIGDTTDQESSGWYSYGIEWEFDTYDQETIDSGTMFVYFSGSADCDCAASANAGGVAGSHADSDSYARVSLEASFP